MHFQYTVNGAVVEVVVEPQAEGYRVTVDGRSHEVVAERRDDGQILLRMDGQALTATVARQEAARYVALAGHTYTLSTGGRARRQRGPDPGGGSLTASMPGQVIALHVQVGDRVERGAPLVLLEAMKMEQRILAPATGVVTAIHCRVGDVVERGQLLVEVEEE